MEVGGQPGTILVGIVADALSEVINIMAEDGVKIRLNIARVFSRDELALLSEAA